MSVEKEKDQQIFLKDWLVQQIDSGKYDGVEWLDKDKKVFKIPWTHSKKNGYRLERDAALFKEWAIHRGRYKGDTAKEASAWKINFRCALHGVKNIVEMPEIECSYPSSKVYRILPQDSTAKKKKWPEFLPSIPARGMLFSYYIRGCQSMITVDPDAPMDETSPRSSNAIAYTNGPSTPLVCSSEQMVTGKIVQCSEADSSNPEIGKSSSVKCSYIHAFPPRAGNEPMETNVQVVPAFAFVPSMLNRNVAKLTILYGSITVHTETVDCTVGCRVFYGPLHNRQVLDPVLEEDLFGPSNAVQLALMPGHPSPAGRELFPLFKRGLIVRVENGSVFVTPLAPLQVYYGANPYGESFPLAREESTCVFDYNKQFLPALGHYMLNKTQPPLISPCTIISVGHKWTPACPSIYNVISVVVVPLWAEEVMARLGVNLVPMNQEVTDVDKLEFSKKDIVVEEFLNPSVGPTGLQTQ